MDKKYLLARSGASGVFGFGVRLDSTDLLTTLLIWGHEGTTLILPEVSLMTRLTTSALLSTAAVPLFKTQVTYSNPGVVVVRPLVVTSQP